MNEIMKKKSLFIGLIICIILIASLSIFYYKNNVIIKGSELYGFPEPTTLITGSFSSQGQEITFKLEAKDGNYYDENINSVISWFYDLELIACDKPEEVCGSEGYTFIIDEKDIFIYEIRGEAESYI
ncbi:MAG: hypothetical protein MR210_09835 [Erysipelotrichaceae bacterium]|nr:hypothetical protein [Erysipelotrichaceae bacterium]MDY5252032.1 hypothetical protein [Erysipelotrichaceae bacterium]